MIPTRRNCSTIPFLLIFAAARSALPPAMSPGCHAALSSSFGDKFAGDGEAFAFQGQSVLAMSPGDERVCAVVDYMSKSLLCAVVRRTLGSDALGMEAPYCAEQQI